VQAHRDTVAEGEAVRKVVSIYVDPDGYNEMKRLCHSLGVSVSSKMDELIKGWVREATGKEYAETPVNYKGLKNKHHRLERYMNQLQKMLMKQGYFKDLAEAALSHGIDRNTYSNVYEVSVKLMKEWEGPRGPLHLFITFLEEAREKKRIERQLEEIRLKEDR
jgi:hypothetical protein